MKQLFLSLATVTLILQACNKSGATKKGEALKNEEAYTYLLENEKPKFWFLDNGHDYNEYFQFENKNKVSLVQGRDAVYSVKDNKIMIKDFLDFNYIIYEISKEKLVCGLPNEDTLVYIHEVPGTESAKKRAQEKTGDVNPKWLKGKFGTTWKFETGDQVYSFMNDGAIIDALTLRKIGTWKLEGDVLQFNNEKLKVNRLSATFFDYTAIGMSIKLNYKCGANTDGSPMKKNF